MASDHPQLELEEPPTTSSSISTASPRTSIDLASSVSSISPPSTSSLAAIPPPFVALATTVASPLSPSLLSSPSSGTTSETMGLSHEEAIERIRELEVDLVATKNEKNTFEAQYRSLLGKLTTMRNTLGDKLKQDADELDRREQAITDLQATNDDLLSSLETLRNELIQSNSDSDHAHSELEQLRLRAFDNHKNTSEEATSREMALREAQEDLERVRMEREEWEGEAMRERVKREELAARVGSLEFELGGTKTDREMLREDRDREAESAANLLAVLEEFQAAKDRELKTTLGDLESQLAATESQLADYKKRASLAEARLLEAKNDSEKVYALTKELKEKNLLVGKLRHDAVIANEHLTEALRRLKKDSNENSVDRRLVSNVLITFLNTPRADTKRFEMLQLISSILSWSDDQRETVGLQRASGISAPGVITTGLSRASKGHARSGKGKSVEDALGENETFSTLWIEFLLKEASGAAAGASSTPPTAGPSSPTSLTIPLSPNGNSNRYSLSDFPSPPSLSSPGSRRPSYISVPSSSAGQSPAMGSALGLPGLAVNPPQEGIREVERR